MRDIQMEFIFIFELVNIPVLPYVAQDAEVGELCVDSSTPDLADSPLQILVKFALDDD